MLRHFTDCSTHLQFADHAEAGISSGIPTLPLLARQVRAFFRLYDDSETGRCRMHANAR